MFPIATKYRNILSVHRKYTFAAIVIVNWFSLTVKNDALVSRIVVALRTMVDFTVSMNFTKSAVVDNSVLRKAGRG